MTAVPLAGFRPGGPEALFGVGALHRLPDGGLAASMPVGPWLATTGPYVEPAALGVLVDDVLGYVLNDHSPGWSVSTELSMDLCAPVPVEAGGTLTCTAAVVHVDERSAVVDGEVRGPGGVLVARCVLRGRLRDEVPLARPAPTSTSPAFPDLRAALAPEVDLTSQPATVTVSERLANPMGNLHGGMALCLVEAAAAAATPAAGRTASVRLQLVRGTPVGTELELHALRLHEGRSFAVVAVEALADDGRAALLATVTRES